MKYFSKKSLYFLIGFSFVFLAAFGYQSIFGEKDTVAEKKTSINQLESTTKNDSTPLIINRVNEPVAMFDIPLADVCAYLYDVYKLTILPGEHKSALVSLVGQYTTPYQAKQALESALRKKGYTLTGSPLTVTALEPEPVFSRVDWGQSSGQIYIFHGQKLYKVEEFPFLLRRDHFGNFQAALPTGATVYPAPAGSAVAPFGKG